MRAAPRTSRLLVVVALAAVPGCTCYGRYGSLGDYVTESGGGGDAGGHDDGGTSDDGGRDDVGTGSTGTGGTGTNGPTCGVLRLADIAAGIGGFAVDGEDGSWGCGKSARGAGDVSGDGLADVILAASGPADLEPWSGRTYLVLGKASTDMVLLDAVAEGIGGFPLNPEAAADNSGQSVSGAGDVNGDGVPDIIVAAPGADAGGLEGSGRAYVVFGKSDTDPVELDLVADGNGGFALNGEAEGDRAAWEVSGAGDVNGDGLADVVVGAPYADPNGEYSGRSYVVFGKTSTAPVWLADIEQGVGGFALDGEAEGDYAGWSVSGAGDVNGDGLADVVLAAKLASPDGIARSGRTYVVFGKVETDKIALADVAEGVGGFAMDGEAEGDGSGWSVSGAGDMNGDGLEDVMVAARLARQDGTYAGRAYVVLGRADTERISLLDVAQGIGGFAMDGEEDRDHAGLFVSGAGDVSGDGRLDVIIGTLWETRNDFPSGRAYVVFGKQDTQPVALSDVALGIGGFAMFAEAEADAAGRSVSGAGDVNGDGVPDIVVGAPFADTHGYWSGRTYVVFGGDFSCEGR